jgi:hypothetical protein
MDLWFDPKWDYLPITYVMKETVQKYPTDKTIGKKRKSDHYSSDFSKRNSAPPDPSSLNEATKMRDNSPSKSSRSAANEKRDDASSSRRTTRHSSSMSLYCNEKECKEFAVQKGGKCSKHGELKSRYECKEVGCNKQPVVKGGKCREHGGKHFNSSRHYCQHTGCAKYARIKGGMCIAHGGTSVQSHYCILQGCEEARTSSKRCSMHAKEYEKILAAKKKGNDRRRGRKLCKEQGCDKFIQGIDGRCQKHARQAGNFFPIICCKEEGCDKHIQGKGGRCRTHSRLHDEKMLG